MTVGVLDVLSANGGAPGGSLRALAIELEFNAPISIRELILFLRDNQGFRRPFYAIQHRCNDLDSVRDAIADGANAIECDIRKTDHPSEFVVNHDNDWAPERDAIVPYLKGVAQIAKNDSRLAFVLFDCKTDDPATAPRLRELIRTHLTDVVPVRTLISVASFGSRAFFEPIAAGVRETEGYAIDEDNDPVRVSKFFADRGVARHGYGNGTFAYGYGPNIPSSVMLAVAMKWANRSIRFAYVWTLQDTSAMRNYVAMGADGIFVNDVSELVGVVSEANFAKKVRLATRADDPFGFPPRRAYALTVKTGDVGSAGTDANITFKLRGRRGTVSTTIDAEPPGLFERGNTNFVTLIGRHVGTLTELSIGIDDSGNAPGWFLDSVEIRSSGSSASRTVSISQWVDPGTTITRAL